MLTPMDQAQTLVATARREAGLSLRELARLADVSFTTISRIELGEMDPTVGTLHQIIEATGSTLHLSSEPSPRKHPALSDLADAVTRERPDWTSLRSFLDYLARHPEAVAAAITQRPRTSTRLMAALLAGIAEKLADDHGLPRPGWTHTVPKMRPEWSPPGTPRMRDEYRRRTPPQLLDRGLVIDESSLWRDRTTVGI